MELKSGVEIGTQSDLLVGFDHIHIGIVLFSSEDMEICPTKTGCNPGEAHIHNFLPNANCLKDLGSLVTQKGADPHLGHDLPHQRHTSASDLPSALHPKGHICLSSKKNKKVKTHAKKSHTQCGANLLRSTVDCRV